MSLRLFVNKGMSSLFHVLTLLKEADSGIHLVVSHDDPGSPVRKVADEFLTEPQGLSPQEYLQWLLDVCIQREIRLFWPQRRADLVSAHRGPFQAAGIETLVVADPDVLSIVASKSRTYETLRNTDVPIPPYRRFASNAEFRAALDELRPNAKRLCLKPDTSIYGHGFRVLEENKDERERFLSNDTSTTTVAQMEAILAETPPSQPFLLMPFLDGHERSIDCLAQNGELLAHVTRKKALEVKRQTLEKHEAAEHIVRTMTKVFRLNGLFNIQTKDWNGGTYLLEINPRMSGGLPMSCLSGFNFPYWAICAALNVLPATLPTPSYGASVTSLEFPLVLPA